MRKNEVKNIVKTYGNVLRGNRIQFTGMYLFGSCVKSNANKDSDIDVAVLTSDQGMIKWLKKIKLWQLARTVDTRIEPVLLNNKDFFKKNASQLVYEIKRTGEKIL